MFRRIWRRVWVSSIALLACESLVWAEDATQKLVDEAATVLAEVVKTPPSTDAEVNRARKALKTLAKHQPDGLSRIAWAIAVDERQSDYVRGEAFLALAGLPDSSAGNLRAFLLPILKDPKAPKPLRMFVAFSFEKARIADQGARKLLEGVLLRSDDDHIVQRTCLRALAATAKLAKIRDLLLRPELYDHPYFAIRVDVCAGLAALKVRDRRALEILCSLMKDADPADKQLLVAQEAWLSFWILTGRTHGIEDKSRFTSRPSPHLSEDEIRRHLWDVSWVRKGVTAAMAKDLAEFTRDARALQRASEMSHRDIDAILGEWRAAEAK